MFLYRSLLMKKMLFMNKFIVAIGFMTSFVVAEQPSNESMQEWLQKEQGRIKAAFTEVKKELEKDENVFTNPELALQNAIKKSSLESQEICYMCSATHITFINNIYAYRKRFMALVASQKTLEEMNNDPEMQDLKKQILMKQDVVTFCLEALEETISNASQPIQLAFGLIDIQESLNRAQKWDVLIRSAKNP